MKNLLPLALLGAGLYFFKGSKTAEKLEFFPKKFHYDKQNKQLLFIMDILNPTNNRLTVDSVFAGVMSNDIKIGSIERGESFTLEKNKRTEVRFPVKPVGLGILQAVAKAIKGEKQAFSIVGMVHALGVDTPINEEIPFSL